MNLSDQEFHEIRLLVKSLCGIWLGDDKKYLVKSRLEPVVKRNELSGYTELIQRAAVASNVRLHEEIIESITTKETSFNRDEHPFVAIQQTILPRLIANRLVRQRTTGLPFGKLRIWSAAASTGQEAYSLAMAVLDHIRKQPRNAAQGLLVTPDNFSITATDISSQALSVASQGVYHQRDIERGLTKDQHKYFVAHNGKYSIHPQVKQLIDFKRLNLVKPFAEMNGFDLVLCRNLLIYFDEPTRRQVMLQLTSSLASGGMLLLGAVESLPWLPSGIIQEQIGKTVVFRKLIAS